MSDVTVAPADAATLRTDREALLRVWIDVTDAGGAVGFRPPADPAAVAAVLDELLAAVDAGSARVVVARDAERVPVGLVAVHPGGGPRVAHRVTLRRLMVHPRWQGTGIGARLVTAAHDLAVRTGGAELAVVEVRGGLGLEAFYLGLGYAEVGRIPDGLAFEDGDRVDEVFLARRLP